MLVFVRRPGGNQLASAAMVLSCLQFGAVLLFMTVHGHMLQWQYLGFSNAKHRSNPCWFDCDRLPAYTGSQGRAERSMDSPQGGCLQCSKCQPGRKLVGHCSAAEHLPQRLPNFRPQELLRPPMLALTILPSQLFSLSAVTAGCSTSCL